MFDVFVNGKHLWRRQAYTAKTLRHAVKAVCRNIDSIEIVELIK
jgi:hypothetical protein